MAKAKWFSVFERGRIVEPHKQGCAQHSFAAEVGRSKTVILNFLKDPESYGTKKMSSGRPKKDQGNTQDGPKERRNSPGRSPSSGRRCELQCCPVERPSNHADKGPQSRGMPAATCPHSQPPFDPPAQPEAPLSHWRKKHPRSWWSRLHRLHCAA